MFDIEVWRKECAECIDEAGLESLEAELVMAYGMGMITDDEYDASWTLVDHAELLIALTAEAAKLCVECETLWAKLHKNVYKAFALKLRSLWLDGKLTTKEFNDLGWLSCYGKPRRPQEVA